MHQNIVVFHTGTHK